jgi:hypothetical protein
MQTVLTVDTAILVVSTLLPSTLILAIVFLRRVWRSTARDCAAHSLEGAQPRHALSI